MRYSKSYSKLLLLFFGIFLYSLIMISGHVPRLVLTASKIDTVAAHCLRAHSIGAVQVCKLQYALCACRNHFPTLVRCVVMCLYSRIVPLCMCSYDSRGNKLILWSNMPRFGSLFMSSYCQTIPQIDHGCLGNGQHGLFSVFLPSSVSLAPAASACYYYYF